VQALCSKGISLQSGTIHEIGTTDQVVANYLKKIKNSASGNPTGNYALGSGLKLNSFDFSPSPVTSGSPVRFCLGIAARHALRISDLALLVYSPAGVRLAVLDFRGKGVPRELATGESFELRGDIASLPLVEGDYSIGLYVNAGNIADNFLDLATLGVGPSLRINGQIPYPAVHRGVIELAFQVSQNQTQSA
jgi:hypothetical protein